MSYKLLVTPINGHFQATALEFSNIAVEAPTRAEAIEQASTAIQKLLLTGEVVEVNLERPKKRKKTKKRKTLLDFAGMWKDDPMFDEFVAAMARYRQEIDADPNQP